MSGSNGATRFCSQNLTITATMSILIREVNSDLSTSEVGAHQVVHLRHFVSRFPTSVGPHHTTLLAMLIHRGRVNMARAEGSIGFT